MDRTKNEAAPLARNDPDGETTETIVAKFDTAVKANDARTAIYLANLSPTEAVALLRNRFPSLDKSLLSKCCNPDKYGCVLHPEAYVELMKALGITQAHTEPVKRRKAGRHVFTCRISARLPDEQYLSLQQTIHGDGYHTMQDWLSDTVKKYLEESHGKHP